MKWNGMGVWIVERGAVRISTFLFFHRDVKGCKECENLKEVSKYHKSQGKLKNSKVNFLLCNDVEVRN